MNGIVKRRIALFENIQGKDEVKGKNDFVQVTSVKKLIDFFESITSCQRSDIEPELKETTVNGIPNGNRSPCDSFKTTHSKFEEETEEADFESEIVEQIEGGAVSPQVFNDDNVGEGTKPMPENDLELETQTRPNCPYYSLAENDRQLSFSPVTAIASSIGDNKENIIATDITNDKRPHSLDDSGLFGSTFSPSSPNSTTENGVKYMAKKAKAMIRNMVSKGVRLFSNLSSRSGAGNKNFFKKNVNKRPHGETNFEHTTAQTSMGGPNVGLDKRKRRMTVSLTSSDTIPSGTSSIFSKMLCCFSRLSHRESHLEDNDAMANELAWNTVISI